jgi:hypothetical protein
MKMGKIVGRVRCQTSDLSYMVGRFELVGRGLMTQIQPNF